jgi:lipid-binding SYLF domain-containing protein
LIPYRPVQERKSIPVQTAFRILTLVSLALGFGSGTRLWAGGRESAILESANDVLEDLTAIPLKGIPKTLLRNAQGVAIIPGVFKAGLIIGGRHGRGVMLMRQPDGSWGPPLFVSLSGLSIGHQIGVQATDLVLVFMTRAGLDRVRHGKITLGADVAVAAGPIGRHAEASTDALLKSEILSYSRSRGLFAGISLEGAALLLDTSATEAFNHSVQGGWIDTPIGSTVPLTPPSVRLQLKLALLNAPTEPPAGVTPVPVSPPLPSDVEPPLPPAPVAVPAPPR